MSDGPLDPGELERRRERDEHERNELADLADKREREELELQRRERAADDTAADMKRRLDELGDHVTDAHRTDRDAYRLEHWGKDKPEPEASESNDDVPPETEAKA